MSRFDIARELALRAIVVGPSGAAGAATRTLIPVAADRDGHVAAGLLARLDDEGRPVRALFFAFEWQNGSWAEIFEHDDEWCGETIERPVGPPALQMTTSIRGDATAAGRPVLAFAGVATTMTYDAVCMTEVGQHRVSIDPATGGFVVIALGRSVELVLRDEHGATVDRLAYTAPPPESW